MRARMRHVGFWCACALLAGVSLAGASELVLDGVPQYYDSIASPYLGSSPTSGGMLMAYWAAQPGYGNLFNTDVSYDVDPGPTNDQIASPEHLDYFTWPFSETECWHFNDPHPSGPNSIACFMHTDPADGETYGWNMATGFRRFADWDNPETEYSDSAAFSAQNHYVYHSDWEPEAEARPGTFTYDHLKREIASGRPLMLNLSVGGGGLSVVAYGYQDNGEGDQWFAVRDTWSDGNSNGTAGIVAKEAGDVEWWKWTPAGSGSDWGAAYYASDAVYLEPNLEGVIEESGTNNSSGDPQLLPPASDTLTISGNISASGDEDWFAFDVEAGASVILTTQHDYGDTSATNTVLDLYDSGASLLRSNNDFWNPGEAGLTYLSHLWYEADATTTYLARVTGWGLATGDYHLVLTVIPPTAQPIPAPPALALCALGAALGIVLIRLRDAKAAAGGSNPAA